MWITIVPSEQIGDGELSFPRSLWKERSPGPVRLRYGSLEAKAVLVPPPDQFRGRTGDGQSREHPVSVLVGKGLVKRLQMRTEPVYQLLRSDGCLEIGPVVGLWVSVHNFQRISQRRPDRIARIYARTGGLFCVMESGQISPEKGRAAGLYYHPESGQWRQGNLPLPAVVYRRVFSRTPSGLAPRQLLPGVRFFNSRRHTKWELYQLGKRDPLVAPHLPDTVRVDQGDEVLAMVQKYGAVVLKPEHLSRGRGILFLEREADGGFWLTGARQKGQGGQRLMEGSLVNYIRRTLVGRRYLCQQRIDLARVGQAPFDIRVMMQRIPSGEWRCTGILCRVAGEGNLVTNVARGGQGIWLQEALTAAFGSQADLDEARTGLLRLAEAVCQMMDRTGEEYGEFGLDLALDQSGTLWLIEANVLPACKAFRQLDPALHRRIRLIPWLYAIALGGFETGLSDTPRTP